MEYKDYYKVLGVSKTATEKDIRTAYRRLARELHPDLNPKNLDAEKRFKDVNEAYDVLSDKEKRAKYDKLGANWKQYEQWERAGGPTNGQPFDVGDLFAGAGGSGGGGRRGGRRTVTADDLGDVFAGQGASSPFSDFFETFFGGTRPSSSGRGGPSMGRRGSDIEQPVDVSLEEAFSGATRVIQLTDDRGSKPRRIEVKIPPGVTDGSRVRAAGQGAPGALSAQSGDLFLLVRVVPSPLFAREGDDLRVKVPVRLTTAVLGGEIEVPTPKGARLALKIPAETQNGRVFRLRGQGMPRLGRSSERGHLFAEVQVKVPEGLTPRQKELFGELAEIEGAATAE